MKNYVKFMQLLLVVLVFLFGIWIGEENYSDFNLQWYKDANALKGDLLDNTEASLDLFYEFVYNREMDTGKYDELIDSLESNGLDTLRRNYNKIMEDECHDTHHSSNTY